MKAIILAAWEWTRLRPLTYGTPKPLIKICWKSILEYNLEAIYKYVDEIIIIVKYLREKIIEEIWNNYKWVKITYHIQWEEKWTWWALFWIEFDSDVLILYWDGILDKKDIEKVIKSKYYWCLVKEVKEPEKYWIYKQYTDWYAKEIVEKPKSFIGNLANLWSFKFNSNIFKCIKNIKKSPRWEYEITCAINEYLKNNKFKLYKINWEFIDIGYPEDVEKAERQIINSLFKKPRAWESTLIEKFEWFELHLWLPNNLIEKLIEFSLDLNDKELQSWTSDLKRFSNKQKFISWYNDKDRYLFSLLSDTQELAWIWWWRPCLLPDIKEIIDNDLYKEILENKNSIHTSGIRIYPKFRWKWLAKILLKSEDYYRKIFPNCYMSIDIESNNIPSQKASEKAWYKFLAKWQNNNSSKELNWEKERLIYIKAPK